MSSSPSEKKSSDVEMGEANSALPTPAMHEATPTFIAGFLSFKERLSRRSAEKEGGRIQPEVPAILSSPAMSTSAGGNKSPGDATPLAESAMVPVQVPEVSAQPSGSSTTPVPAPKEEKATEIRTFGENRVLLHYVDDPPGHAGLHCCPEQESKAQPCLAVQYRSMSEMESRSMSDKGYRSTEGLCCRSTWVSENWSTGLVSGSTVDEQNRATRKCCCRSIGSALPYGSCVPNLHDLVRISVGIPCCFCYCWACT
ncbi:hypothetical protein F2Q70_00026220 [Brassica cretica]|uniref:Uncharacterized protein n=1 Tax=Brassica cretica TaxID=69181 RepID=A0A8S9LD38_BRACR|nr:hypothetical protein F2Q70_00026220 [Brassica cretica]